MKIKELIIDAHHCKADLNDEKILLEAMSNAAKKINATIVKSFYYKYKPQGVSAILLLAESHISIYTWPEHKYAAVEIFLCNEKMDPYAAWEEIKKTISPENNILKEVINNID